MVTQRDAIWAATLRVMEFERTFTASIVREHLEDESPSRRTVRNTLDAMVSLGFLKKRPGSGRTPTEYYPVSPAPSGDTPGYTPRQNGKSGTIPYPGGKGQLADWIIKTMPIHDTYVEVFGGAAGVLYRKPKSKYEIYNDQNEDLTQFFRMLRDRPDELAEWLHTVPYSRSQYEEWVQDFYEGYRPDDPIERAGRFFSLRYMQYIGISSEPNGFKVRARRSPARSFDNARRRLNDLAQRFDQVVIENRDYQSILKGYDDSAVEVLFYLDPPYIDAEEQYGTDFNHERFVDCLHDVKNDWMVSYEEIPDGLEEYTIVEHDSRHRMQRDEGDVIEKLICNFDPHERKAFTSAVHE